MIEASQYSSDGHIVWGQGGRHHGRQRTVKHGTHVSPYSTCYHIYNVKPLLTWLVDKGYKIQM